MEDLTDRQFGSFRVVGALGRGGMAAVYKVYQPAMNRHVALKVLSRHLSADPQFLRRFRREAFILAQLQHPRILQVYDSGESDGYAYLAMPLVTGGTLATALKRGQRSLGGAVRIVGQICDALDYAHSKHIVHRDIKPTNILLDERHNCLVADFGLARILENSVTITIVRSVMGTPRYMSPEQAKGADVGPPSDIYSLGVVLYELLTGRVPFIADTPTAIMMAHLTAPIPPPRTFNPAVPAAIEDVVLKALARAPEDRFTAREFRAALMRAVRDLRISAISDSLHESQPDQAADISSVFATIGSDAFLSDLVDDAPVNVAPAVAAPPPRARILVAAFAVGTILFGTAFTLSYKGGGTTAAPPPVSVGAQSPSSAAATPSPSTVPDARSEESPAIGRAPEGTRAPLVSAAAPVSRSRPASENAESVLVVPVDRGAKRVEPIVVPPARIDINAPPSSRVYVDDVFRGETGADGHLVIETLAPGTHAVKISLAGKRDFVEMVETIRGETTMLRPALLDATASIRIRTSAGAEVLVDSLSRGVADADGVLLLSDLPPGPHDIRVLLLDKKEFRQTTTLESGRESTLEARLENLASPPNASLKPSPVPETPGNRRFLLFHFVDGSWHFGVLTMSPGRIAWDETKRATASYSIGRVRGFRSIEPGLHLDNFDVGCTEVRDAAKNAAVVGEHIRLGTRNYNFAQAVPNEDKQLVPKDNAPIGLQQAVNDACPGAVR